MEPNFRLGDFNAPPKCEISVDNIKATFQRLSIVSKFRVGRRSRFRPFRAAPTASLSRGRRRVLSGQTPQGRQGRGSVVRLGLCRPSLDSNYLFAIRRLPYAQLGRRRNIADAAACSASNSGDGPKWGCPVSRQRVIYSRSDPRFFSIALGARPHLEWTASPVASVADVAGNLLQPETARPQTRRLPPGYPRARHFDSARQSAVQPKAGRRATESDAPPRPRLRRSRARVFAAGGGASKIPSWSAMAPFGPSPLTLLTPGSRHPLTLCPETRPAILRQTRSTCAALRFPDLPLVPGGRYRP